MNASLVDALVRSWAELYTRGVPAALRAARRDEIDDDLWCQNEEAAALGRSPRALGAEMLMRLLLGMPADVSWRLSHGGRAVASDSERSSSVSTRLIGAMAVIAGASWGITVILVLAFGESVWTGPNGAVIGAIGLGGGVAFAATAIGLIWRFQDQVGPVGVAGGLLAGLGVLLGTLGGYAAYVVLPVGSAVLTWDLARAGILPRSLSVVHAVSAVAFLAPLIATQVDYAAVIGNSLLIGLAIPYMLSWMAIGASLLRGIPQAHQPAPGV